MKHRFIQAGRNIVLNSRVRSTGDHGTTANGLYMHVFVAMLRCRQDACRCHYETTLTRFKAWGVLATTSYELGSWSRDQYLTFVHNPRYPSFASHSSG